MKLVIDMNLSPEWCPFLNEAGYESVHWSTVGDVKSPDRVIMDWAKQHSYVVFTHDLDFGAILASTNAEGPSVLQIRTLQVLPERIGSLVVSALHQFDAELNQGALITIDEHTRRARILPINR